MKFFTLLISIVLFATISYAQDLETDQANKKEVSKLTFLSGDWKGKGWMTGYDGQKHTFSQSEILRFKLDSTALVIEGTGMDNGKVIHNAMAIITYNKTGNNYSFHSYLANGREGKFKAELISNKLFWYPIENMRYIIFINEKGQWYETGEMKTGEKWNEFFQMTLEKQ